MPRAQGYRHHEDTRKKIQAAQIINRLEKHVFSDEPLLDASQVNAAKALLAKVLPDLQSVSVDGNMKHSADDAFAKLFADIAANGRRIHDKD